LSFQFIISLNIAPCKQGSFSDDGLEPCQPCRIGDFQDETKKTVCKQCVGGGKFGGKAGAKSQAECPSMSTT